jgi:hypothetical protein
MTKPPSLFYFCDAEKWNRTTDTGIFSPLLYRLSYLGMLIPARNGILFLRIILIAHFEF